MIAALLALGIPLAGSPALAPPGAAWTLPQIEVRATRFGDRTGPLPLASTVLDRSTIARRPDADLADLLRPLAGLRVVSHGADALGASLSIRGSSPEQVLVLVDGRRWNSAQGGGFDLASIPVESIERIEVFRGGASAAWGADAIGGAVHVTTRGAASVAPRLRVAAGSAGAREIAGSAGVALGGAWSARAGASFEESRGDAPIRGAEISRAANADAQRAAADACVETRIAGRTLLRLDASALGLRRGAPGSEEFPSPSARLDDDRATLGLRAEHASGAFVPSLDVFATSMQRSYREPGAPSGAIDESHDNRRIEGEVGSAFLAARTSVQAYAGGSIDRLRSTTDGAHSRGNAHVRTHLVRDGTWRGRAARALASVRVDAAEGFAPFVSPRAGFQSDVVARRLLIRGSAGLSFRPPSFDDLFWPARATAAGNPDLRAETARDADLGLAWTSSRNGRLAVEAFARQVDDLIQWSPGAGGIWRPVNLGQARIRGLEAEGEAGAGGPFGLVAALAGSFARTWTQDASGEPNVDGKELIYRPRWTGAATLSLARPHRAELEGALRFVGDTWVTRANTKRLEGHALVDLRARIHPRRGVALDAAVTNLLDRPARDFRDFPLPGRSVEIGITIERSSP